MTNYYYERIGDLLQGATEELKGIPSGRLDWDGVGAVLELYDSTSGTDREDLIRVMGRIIEEAKYPAPVVAQVIQLASSLDLAQVEPNVFKLRDSLNGAGELDGSTVIVKQAITNYLAFRQLARRKIKPS